MSSIAEIIATPKPHWTKESNEGTTPPEPSHGLDK
jgi:hypothetical protein